MQYLNLKSTVARLNLVLMVTNYIFKFTDSMQMLAS